ncbi:MAG: transcriptional regulator [Gemmatimonadales bacterium]|nr:transcriptional regulator [Gemmatimonadales bacterium]
MPAKEPLGPFCQSCSMPLEKPDDFGTDQAGYRENDYCRHCYKGGAFTEPDMTMEQMLDVSVGFMVRQGIMPEASARALLGDVMPRLKRWCASASARPLAAAGSGREIAGDPEC